MGSSGTVFTDYAGVGLFDGHAINNLIAAEYHYLQGSAGGGRYWYADYDADSECVQLF
ncbi:hypothetical protein TUM17567_43470 [Citrobacter amalonaticus]|nr:hypothetical protein TUM17567_43470 [Citrobacter amalonaticus]